MMFFSNFLQAASILFLSAFPSVARAASLASDSAAFIAISGNTMAGVEIPSGDTRVYYQDSSNGSILQLGITNAFTVGQYFASEVLVPSSEARSNSPIAAAALVNDETGLWEEIHVFFFSPENILSEYYYFTKTEVWNGGPTCTDCLTTKGFVGLAGNQMLYAMASSATTPPTLRVGFASAGAPNTISEAVNTGNGWSLASLS